MRWKCVCAYDGSGFHGWQSQKNSEAVQDVIEKSLKTIFEKRIRIHGSGRTDTGVHARGQVFHFDASWRHDSGRLLAAFRALLPVSIQIKSAKLVPESFHARYGAKGKEYRYYIYRGTADPFKTSYCWSIDRSLDLAKMQKAADLLVGKHDFVAFSLFNGDKVDTIKDLRVLSVNERGRHISVTAEGSGFLYKMVRSLTGALVNVGQGKLTPTDLYEILKNQKRVSLVRTAPAQGLFLEKVKY
ncbi:MAG: tRNA pseudouridine(38-40) synthase TruA [Opitutaceae bacterium]|nr:tRNA pseudouridine(38-40) synthase TruA [Opitutaceae bacterium]